MTDTMAGMGRIIGALAVVVVVLMAAGCSSEQEAPAGPATTTAPGAIFSDAEFYEMARGDDGDYFDGKPDADVETAAKVVCGVFTPSKGGDATTQWAAAVKALIGMGFDARSAGAFTVAATAGRCTSEYKYLPKG